MKDTVHPTSISFKDFTIKGVSTAGIGTCLTIPEWKLAFDVAQGLPFAFPMSHFLISHLHQDHASGIPYIISQKAMQSHKPPTFYLPQGTADKVHQIMKIWAELEDHNYDFILKEPKLGERIPINPHLFAETFSTRHRVRSQGYTIFQSKKRLSRKFKDLSREEILKLRSQGVEIEETQSIPKVSFTGDTQIEFLDLSPQVTKSEVLIMEVTYIDEKRGVESARKWGHIHFKEIAQRLSQIESEKIVWIHLSARHTRTEVDQMIREHLPGDRDRIIVL